MLGTLREPAMVDTIVMSNLGYFQLKAAPGAFDLQLAPGRSRQLYTIDNSTSAVAAQVSRLVASRFISQPWNVRLRVVRVLWTKAWPAVDTDETSSSLWWIKDAVDVIH